MEKEQDRVRVYQTKSEYPLSEGDVGYQITVPGDEGSEEYVGYVIATLQRDSLSPERRNIYEIEEMVHTTKYGKDLPRRPKLHGLTTLQKGAHNVARRKVFNLAHKVAELEGLEVEDCTSCPIDWDRFF